MNITKTDKKINWICIIGSTILTPICVALFMGVYIGINWIINNYIILQIILQIIMLGVFGIILVAGMIYIWTVLYNHCVIYWNKRKEKGK